MLTCRYELIVRSLDGKELFTIEGSKTGAHLQTTWRSAKNTTTRNWNVHVLLHNPLQQKKGDDRRYFHQLFRQLRLANMSSHSSMRISGTSITCSETWISCGAKASTNSCSSTSGTGTSSIGARMICSTVCRWTRSCGLTWKSRSGRAPPGSLRLTTDRRAPAGEWGHTGSWP